VTLLMGAAYIRKKTTEILQSICFSRAPRAESHLSRTQKYAGELHLRAGHDALTDMPGSTDDGLRNRGPIS
jgi:hypothetical protein